MIGYESSKVFSKELEKVKKISKQFDDILNENLGLPTKNKILCEEDKDMKQRLETLISSKY